MENALDQSTNKVKFQNFFIISLKQSICLNIPVDGIFVEFCQVFDHDYQSTDRTCILKPLQRNSSEFKRKLQVFLNKNSPRYPMLKGLIGFSKILPENHFFIIDFSIGEDSEKIMDCYKILNQQHEKHGIEIEVDSLYFNWGAMLNNYNMATFGNMTRNIGKEKAEDRVCRFCNTGYAQANRYGELVYFRNRAHIIPEALGNKKLFNSEECDSCNQRFSKSIEVSLINLLKPFRAIHGLEGKKGKKEFRGENFNIDSDGVINIKLDVSSDELMQSKEIKSVLVINDTFIPQDLYRSLVKFILGVLPKKHLNSFQRTISWINKDFDGLELPLISSVQHHDFMISEPILVYYKKKVNNPSLPDLIGEFHYADLVFVFIIPYNDQDRSTFTDQKEFLNFWDTFISFRPKHQWNHDNWAGTQQIKMSINLDIENVIIGENTFVSEIATE